MKHSWIKLTIVCLIGCISCTETALYDLDIAPRKINTTDRLPSKVRPINLSGVSPSTLIGNLSSVNLQVIRSEIAAETGNLVIFFAGTGDLSTLQLSDQQTIEFTDSEGGSFSQTLPVLHTAPAEDLLVVTFGTGRGYGEDSEPEDEQSIIVQDVIIN